MNIPSTVSPIATAFLKKVSVSLISTTILALFSIDGIASKVLSSPSRKSLSPVVIRLSILDKYLFSSILNLIFEVSTSVFVILLTLVFTTLNPSLTSK